MREPHFPKHNGQRFEQTVYKGVHSMANRHFITASKALYGLPTIYLSGLISYYFLPQPWPFFSFLQQINSYSCLKLYVFLPFSGRRCLHLRVTDLLPFRDSSWLPKLIIFLPLSLPVTLHYLIFFIALPLFHISFSAYLIFFL